MGQFCVEIERKINLGYFWLYSVQKSIGINLNKLYEVIRFDL